MVLGEWLWKRLLRNFITILEKILAGTPQSTLCISKNRQSMIYQIQWLNAEEKSKRYESKKVVIEEQLQEHRNKMQSFVDSLKDLEKKYKKENQEVDILTVNLNKAKSKLIRFERQRIQLAEETKHLKDKLKKLKKDVERSEGLQSSKQETLESNKKDIESNRKKSSKLETPLKKEEKILEKMYEELKDEVAPLHVKLEEKQNKSMPWQKKIDETKARLDLALNELSIFTIKSTSAREKLLSSNADLEKLAKIIHERQLQVKQEKQECEATKKKIIALENERRGLMGNDDALLEQASKARAKAEELKRSLEQSRQESKVLTKLMQLKTKGQLPGIYGRLGNLGTIADMEKYDVAISTACGRLDNIVVDTADTATKCVEILRHQNIGRATFIILEKISNTRSDSLRSIEIPPNSERLYDIIEVREEEIKLAFYFALRDTLVTDSLDRATQIAYSGNRWRVVTLDGDLIDLSGTMSGGGTRKQRGGMTRSVAAVDPGQVKEELQKYLKIAEEKTLELQKTREEMDALDNEIEQTKLKLRTLEQELPRHELDIKELTKQREELSRRIPHLEAQTKLSETEEAKMKDLQREIKTREEAAKRAQNDAEELLNEIKEIQHQIDNAGGDPLREQKAKVEKISNAIEDANKTVTKLEVANVALVQAMEKIVKVRDKNTQEIKNLDEEIKKKGNELENLVEATNEVEKEQKELKEIFDEKSKTTKSIHKDLEKQKKDNADNRSTEVDLLHKLEDIQKLLSDDKARAQDFTKKLKKLAQQKAALVIDEKDSADLPILTEEELSGHNVDDLNTEIAALKQELSSMKPNMSAIKEYRQKEAECLEKQTDLDNVTTKRDEKRKEYENFRKKRLDEFMTGFNLIRRKLSEMYKMITLDDGDADLEPNDTLDPFSEGISFRVRPPKKSWKFIHNLSGGEKTLSSLALVFALHTYKPNPIYIMDEIDAALDFKNVSIIANYIKERTKNAQFLIVSLRNFMFELADRLVGIYKTENCTKSVTINPANLSVPRI